MEPARKQKPVLMPERLGMAEDKQHNFVADAESGITPEDIMEPSYWAHVAPQMQPMDEIKVRAEDGSWVAYLLVRYAERNYASVKLRQLLQLETEIEAPATSLKHEVKWRGPLLKFCVLRLTGDRACIKQGCVSRAEALSWMVEHEKTA